MEDGYRYPGGRGGDCGIVARGRKEFCDLRCLGLCFGDGGEGLMWVGRGAGVYPRGAVALKGPGVA